MELRGIFMPEQKKQTLEVSKSTSLIYIGGPEKARDLPKVT